MPVKKVLRKVAKKYGSQMAGKVSKLLKNKKAKSVRKAERKAKAAANPRYQKDVKQSKEREARVYKEALGHPSEVSSRQQALDRGWPKGKKGTDAEYKKYVRYKKGITSMDAKKKRKVTGAAEGLPLKSVKKDGKTIDTKVVRKVDSKKLLQEMEQAKATGKRAEAEKLLKKLKEMKAAQKVLLRKLQQKKREAFKRAERKANIKTIKSTGTEQGVRAAKAAAYNEAKRRAEERKKAVAARRKKKK